MRTVKAVAASTVSVDYANNKSVAAAVGSFRCSGCLHDAARVVMHWSEYFIARCIKCDLAHFLPRPQVEQEAHQLQDLGSYELDMKRLRPGLDYHSMKLLHLLGKYCPPPGKLLEIGCATGLFLNDAHAAGYSVTGIEPAAGHRELIPPQIASSVFLQKLEDADLPDSTFDVIVAIQLIEHLLDPTVFAEQLKRVLKPGGIAYVETPNFDCVSRRLQVSSWMKQNIFPGHWHLFNPRSMVTFCERIGLRVVRGWTFFKALGIHSRSASLGKSMVALDHTLGRMGMGNNVAVLITKN
jgi:SAM-dependent methyltransferase